MTVLVRTATLAVGVILLAGSLAAQGRSQMSNAMGGGGGMYRGGSFGHGGPAIIGRPPAQYGYGNILFPGGITAYPNGITWPPAPRVGWGMGTPPPQAFPRPDYGRARTIAVPYAFPVFVGGGGYYGPGYDSGNSTNVTVVVPQQPTPQVVINQNFTPDVARPAMRDYSNTELPESSPGVRIYQAPTGGQSAEPQTAATAAPAPKPAARTRAVDEKATIYLIALKDGAVRSAIGYWMEDSTLLYVTPQGAVNRVSVDMLDQATTKQLNQERNVEWELTLP